MLFANSWYDVAWVAGMAPEFYELSAGKALCLIEPILVRQKSAAGDLQERAAGLGHICVEA